MSPVYEGVNTSTLVKDSEELYFSNLLSNSFSVAKDIIAVSGLFKTEYPTSLQVLLTGCRRFMNPV